MNNGHKWKYVIYKRQMHNLRNDARKCIVNSNKNLVARVLLNSNKEMRVLP